MAPGVYREIEDHEKCFAYPVFYFEKVWNGPITSGRDEEMKRLMINAYTKLNLGDDLFVKLLCERYPDTNFVLPAMGEYRTCLGSLPNLTIYPIESVWVRGARKLLKSFKSIEVQKLLLQRLARRCDGVVQIGGSVFMQGKNWVRDYNWKREIYGPNKPYFVMGANFGPYKDEVFYEKHRELFSGYTDICFRDEYSYELFRDLGNVRLAPDIVFQHPKPDTAGGESVVISVIKPSERENLKALDTIYYEKIRDIAVAFILEGYDVSLMSFCEYEGDEEAVRSIYAMIPETFHSRTEMFFYRTNLEDAITLLASSGMIVATRFHAMILGWVFGKPVFPIAYSEKTINVMKDANFEGAYADLKSIASLDPDTVVRSQETNRLNVSVLAAQAEKHFLELDKYLGRSQDAAGVASAMSPGILARRGHES